MTLLKQSERFNTNHPALCPALKWKAQFIAAPEDASVQSTLDHQYWCVYTQTCLGPDGALAEPYLCSVPSRSCHVEALKNAK